MLVDIIIIGDEILIGQVIDTNSSWMAQQLNKIGIRVRQIHAVADESPAIKAALGHAATADVVLCTGGLGPTKDDITRETLASYFNSSIHRNQEVLTDVTRLFERYNRPMLEINLRQADVLDVSEVLPNKVGTAPGMWIKHKDVHYVFMPGVPFEMKYVMYTHVLPRLQRLPGRQPLVHLSILTAGLGESFLADQLKSIEEELPLHVHLAYLPKYGQVRLRLSTEGDDVLKLRTEIDVIAREIEQRLHKYVVARGDDTLEEHVVNLLKERNETFFMLESGTGGYLSNLFSSTESGKDVFLGAVVLDQKHLKAFPFLRISPAIVFAHGVVSKESAEAMCEEMKNSFATNYAMAIIGFAATDEDTDNLTASTVTVWIAVSGPTKSDTKQYHFEKNQQANVERASAMAILMLYNLIKMENTAEYIANS